MSIRQTTSSTYTVRVAVETINKAMPTPDISAAVAVIERTPNAEYGGYVGRLFYANPPAAAAVQAALGKSFIVESHAATSKVCKAIGDAAFAQLNAFGTILGLDRQDINVFYDGPDGYSIHVEVDDPAKTSHSPSPIAGVRAVASKRFQTSVENVAWS